jgi:hypothetical protein
MDAPVSAAIRAAPVWIMGLATLAEKMFGKM